MPTSIDIMFQKEFLKKEETQGRKSLNYYHNSNAVRVMKNIECKLFEMLNCKGNNCS